MLDFNWTYVTMFVFPIFTAVGVMLATNLIVFPELGSTHLGLVTIQALQSSLLTIRAASKMFVSGEPRDALPDTLATLGELTAQKRDLRLAVDKCKAVYQECSFELAYSYIPPKDLKEIGVKNMRKFVDNVIALIGACESRFTANDSSNIDGSATPHSPLFHTSDSSASLLQILKPRRELGRGCEDLLNTLLESIKVPLLEFQTELEDAIDAVMMNVAYAYVSSPKALQSVPSNTYRASLSSRLSKGLILAKIFWFNAQNCAISMLISKGSIMPSRTLARDHWTRWRDRQVRKT